MATDQRDAIAEAFKDLLGLLLDADPRDRAELYSRLGLRMTYQPGPETVIAEVHTPADLRVFDMCPEPNTRDIHTVVAAKELACMP
jgi:hypothetical protein